MSGESDAAMWLEVEEDHLNYLQLQFSGCMVCRGDVDRRMFLDGCQCTLPAHASYLLFEIPRNALEMVFRQLSFDVRLDLSLCCKSRACVVACWLARTCAFVCLN